MEIANEVLGASISKPLSVLFSQRRKNKEAKKYAKEVQVKKQQDRQKEKKQAMDQLKQLKKGARLRIGARINAPR